MAVLERCCDSFFVLELFVDGIFRWVSSRRDLDRDFESRWKCPDEFDTNAESDEGCHWAVLVKKLWEMMTEGIFKMKLTGIVGVNWTKTSPLSLSTVTRLSSSTWSSSNDSGCSGSLMFLIRSESYDLMKPLVQDLWVIDFSPKTSRSSIGSTTFSSMSLFEIFRSAVFLYTFGLIFSSSAIMEVIFLSLQLLLNKVRSE